MILLIYLISLLGGNTFNCAIEKSSNTAYDMGQGIGSEIAYKNHKIAKLQSLRDVVCDVESLEAKLVELRQKYDKQTNRKKKADIKNSIDKLTEARATLADEHDKMDGCKTNAKNAARVLIEKVYIFVFAHTNTHL
jgi:hypothetical protein